jgi:hypothetical protein
MGSPAASAAFSGVQSHRHWSGNRRRKLGFAAVAEGCDAVAALAERGEDAQRRNKKLV